MQLSKCLTFSVVGFVTFLFVFPASAQLVEVPNLPGNGNYNIPIPFSLSSFRYQQIYSASAFPQGGTIDKIRFQPVNSYNADEFDFQLALSYAATTVNTASTTFANNIGDDFTVVFDGLLIEPIGPPFLFGFEIDVANTFTYDPSRGDLLMQIVNRRGVGPVVFDGSNAAQQNVTNMIWGDLEYAMGAVGRLQQGRTGIVTQFEFVPEPSAFAQFGSLLLLMGANRRIKRR